jgi:aspartate carbamoyltransferase regulatory subunit
MMHNRHKHASSSSNSNSNSSSNSSNGYITIDNEVGISWLTNDVYKARSMECFMHVRNGLNIRHHPSDMPEFRCHYCWDHVHNQSTDSKDISKGEAHSLIRMQRYTYQQLGMVTNNPNYMLACQDFTSICTHPNIGAPKGEQEKGNIKALTISMKHNGNWWHYIWLILNTKYKEYGPYSVVAYCWHQLLNETMNNKASPIYGVNKCDIWSDGSAGQFKNQYMLAWYGMTRYWWYTSNNNGSINKSTIRSHFFAPYHGHNICDATAAHIKLVVHNLIEKHEQQCKLNVPGATINVIDSKQVHDALELRLKNCRVTIINDIPNDQLPTRYEWMGSGTKKCFMFAYSPNINDELIVNGYNNSSDHISPRQSWSSGRIVKPNEIWSNTTPPIRMDVTVGGAPQPPPPQPLPQAITRLTNKRKHGNQHHVYPGLGSLYNLNHQYQHHQYL